MKKMKRKLRIKIDETIDEKIPIVKDHYGLKNDLELVRLLISEKYNAIIIKEQLTPSLNIDEEINNLFYQGYLNEFLEELKEKELVLFNQYNEYIDKKSKPSESEEVDSSD